MLVHVVCPIGNNKKKNLYWRFIIQNGFF